MHSSFPTLVSNRCRSAMRLGPHDIKKREGRGGREGSPSFLARRHVGLVTSRLCPILASTSGRREKKMGEKKRKKGPPAAASRDGPPLPVPLPHRLHTKSCTPTCLEEKKGGEKKEERGEQLWRTALLLRTDLTVIAPVSVQGKSVYKLGGGERGGEGRGEGGNKVMRGEGESDGGGEREVSGGGGGGGN